MRALGILAAACGLAAFGWACSSSSTDNEATGSELTGENVVPLGTCTLDKIPADRATMLAPFTPKEPLHFENVVPTDAQILSRLQLTAKVTTTGDKRAVTSVTASLSRGAVNGTLAFNAIASGASGRASEGRAWENRWFQASDPASAITLEKAALPVDTIVLHWEATGKKWAMLGLKGAAPEVKLVATAANCNFELKAWQLLRDLGCEDQLFGDAATNPACTATPEDTFGRVDGGPTPDTTRDAGADTGTPPPPPPPPPAVDAGADAGNTAPPKDDGYSYPPGTGGGNTPGGKTPPGDWENGEYANDTVPNPNRNSAGPGGGDDSADDGKPAPGMPNPAKGKAKPKSDGGCSTTGTGTPSEGLAGVAMLAAVVGQALRRRRRISNRDA